jgi:Ca2+-binding RTX toxin-like protein
LLLDHRPVVRNPDLVVAPRVLPVLIALLPMAVPASASAAFAQREAGGVLTVNGGSESNTVTVTLSGSSFTVTDSAGMDEGAGCTHVNGTTSSCSAPEVARFSAALGAGNDKFSSTVAVPLKVMGEAGQDDISGGAAADELMGGSEGDTIDGGDGADSVVGGDGADVVRGGPGDDHVGAGGELGDDNLDGGSGDDVMDPGSGPQGPATDADVVSGGIGVDELSYAPRTSRVVVTVGGGADDGVAGEHDDVKSDVERVIGGNGGDELRGSPNPETLGGGPGADELDGGGGADTTDGGDGNDSVSGGAGADVVTGGAGDDVVDGSVPGLVGVDEGDVVGGGEGSDRVAGGDGDDALDGGPGADELSGGPGTDGTSYATAAANVTVTLDGLPGDGPPGEGDNVEPDVESLTTGGGEDYADGGTGANVLAMGAAFDVVRARDGVADTVDCGAASDFAIVDKQDRVAASCERVARRGSGTRPLLGRRVSLRPLRGGEAFRLSGMHRTVPLKDSFGVPFGSELDATRGAVQLTAATGGGRTQAGDFSQGAFLVKQSRAARGLTEVVLSGGDLTKCAAAGSGSPKAKTVLRRLFGRAHGRFRTRGRFSTATVRGTEWTVIDRCDGTLTTVRKGSVVVRDLVKHKSVKLRSGQSYLARRGNR